MVDAGTVKLPDGWLSGGDPWWSREGVSFELRLLSGAYFCLHAAARFAVRGALPLRKRHSGA